jgi:glyoxylate reductase
MADSLCHFATLPLLFPLGSHRSSLLSSPSMRPIPKLVISRALPGAHLVQAARRWADVIVAPEGPDMPGVEGAGPPISPAKLRELVVGAAGVITMWNDPCDEAFISAAGPSLKVISTYAAGYDNIDLALCRARGIRVCNTPDAVTEGTANMAVALVLAVARRLVEADTFVRSGRFEHEGNGIPQGWMGMHLAGQTALIVGAGRIGRATAMRLHAFGMKVLYVARSRHIDFEIAPLVARRVELEEGLRLADVVSLHTPLSPETKHLLNRERIAMLKPTAIVVNTARGAVMDESALVDALVERRIFGAGLDVYEFEPKVDPRLANLKNVVLSPHIGSAERQWREVMSEMALDNVRAVFEGREPQNVVV